MSDIALTSTTARSWVSQKLLLGRSWRDYARGIVRPWNAAAALITRIWFRMSPL
jgi:hypothetical protein